MQSKICLSIGLPQSFCVTVHTPVVACDIVRTMLPAYALCDSKYTCFIKKRQEIGIKKRQEIGQMTRRLYCRDCYTVYYEGCEEILAFFSLPARDRRRIR